MKNHLCRIKLFSSIENVRLFPIFFGKICFCTIFDHNFFSKISMILKKNNTRRKIINFRSVQNLKINIFYNLKAKSISGSRRYLSTKTAVQMYLLHRSSMAKFSVLPLIFSIFLPVNFWKQFKKSYVSSIKSEPSWMLHAGAWKLRCHDLPRAIAGATVARKTTLPRWRRAPAPLSREKKMVDR